MQAYCCLLSSSWRIQWSGELDLGIVIKHIFSGCTLPRVLAVAPGGIMFWLLEGTNMWVLWGSLVCVCVYVFVGAFQTGKG